jgi:hypothetical protein
MQRYLHSHPDGGTFDPETVGILTDALDAAWRSLQTTGVNFTSRGQAEAARDRLARHIIEMAKLGERDRSRLRDDALNHLAQSNIHQLHPGTIHQLHSGISGR